MKVSEEFSGPEFAVGSVIGLRRFRLKSQGYLTGVSYAQPWEVGENVATCHALSAGNVTALIASMTLAGIEVARLEAERIAPDHSMPSCRCGFYAYFGDEAGAYRSNMYVAGVVEGYGRTVIGPKGFRSEKARILALAPPPPPPAIEDPEGLADSLGLTVAAFMSTIVEFQVNVLGLPTVQGLTEMRERYADIPMFDTVQQMLAEFPTTTEYTHESAD